MKDIITTTISIDFDENQLGSLPNIIDIAINNKIAELDREIVSITIIPVNTRFISGYNERSDQNIYDSERGVLVTIIHHGY